MKPCVRSPCSEEKKSPLSQISPISFETCLKSLGVVRAAGGESLRGEETLLMLRGKLLFPAVLWVKARTHLRRHCSCPWEVTTKSSCSSASPTYLPWDPLPSPSDFSVFLYPQLDFHFLLGSSHVFVFVPLLQDMSLSAGARSPSLCYVRTRAGTVAGDAPLQHSPGEDLPCAPSLLSCCQATQHHTDFTPKLQNKLHIQGIFLLFLQRGTSQTRGLAGPAG